MRTKQSSNAMKKTEKLRKEVLELIDKADEKTLKIIIAFLKAVQEEKE